MGNKPSPPPKQCHEHCKKISLNQHSSEPLVNGCAGIKPCGKCSGPLKRITFVYHGADQLDAVEVVSPRRHNGRLYACRFRNVRRGESLACSLPHNLPFEKNTFVVLPNYKGSFRFADFDTDCDDEIIDKKACDTRECQTNLWNFIISQTTDSKNKHCTQCKGFFGIGASPFNPKCNCGVGRTHESIPDQGHYTKLQGHTVVAEPFPVEKYCNGDPECDLDNLLKPRGRPEDWDTYDDPQVQPTTEMPFNSLLIVALFVFNVLLIGIAVYLCRRRLSRTSVSTQKMIDSAEED